MLAAGVSIATMAASKALVTGLRRAPNVAKAIWPSGTSEIRPITQLSSLCLLTRYTEPDLPNQPTKHRPRKPVFHAFR